MPEYSRATARSFTVRPAQLLIITLAALALLVVACVEVEETEDADGDTADAQPTIEMGAQDHDGEDAGADDDGDVPPLYEGMAVAESHSDRRVSLVRYGQQPVEHMAALLMGELALSDGCLGVETQVDGEFFTVVWPVGYSPGLDRDGATLIDENQEVVAREGDPVSLGGGEVPDQNGEVSEAAGEECAAENYWMAADEVWPEGEGPGSEPVATPDPEATPHVQTEQEAREQDAQHYADAFDVSLEEALWRMDMQSRLGTLGQDLEQGLSDRFGGMHWEHEPEYRLVVLMTDGDENAVREYIDDPEIAEILEVRTVELTQNELREIQREAHELVESLGVRASSSTMIQENRVEIYVADASILENALEAADEELPAHVVVLEQELQTDDEDTDARDGD